MQNLDRVIERIKALECPSGDLEKRVEEILKSYSVENSNSVIIKRNEELDIFDMKAYSAKMADGSNKDLIVISKSGLDDYVEKVVDAYIQ